MEQKTRQLYHSVEKSCKWSLTKDQTEASIEWYDGRRGGLDSLSAVSAITVDQPCSTLCPSSVRSSVTTLNVEKLIRHVSNN